MIQKEHCHLVHFQQSIFILLGKECDLGLCVQRQCQIAESIVFLCCVKKQCFSLQLISKYEDEGE